MSNGINNLREFGRFRLDAEKKVLWFENEPVGLQLKEIELLCVLTENGGEVVTKDELFKRVWANSFVEESNLSRHIYRIRKTFAELGESADLIQTVPRRGYRWTGEIHESDSAELVIERHSISRTVVEELENSAQPNLKTASQSNPKKPLWISLAICLAILLGGFAYYGFNSAGAVSDQPINSIAVLPLKSLDNENNKALSMGFADALITNLGKLDKVKILSTNTINRFVDEPYEPLEIGKKLAVDAVIDGTLQRANGKYRVTLRLTRTADGKQIWHSSFDKTESEIFQLQDLMALETASALELNLKSQDFAKHPTDNTDAYQFYLQGLYLFRRRFETSVKSIPLFKKAIELDPKFAKAWAGLAGIYALGSSMDEAEATVNKALELDPNLAEAHAVRGFIKMFLDWDWNEAEKSLNRAIVLDPNSVEAHHWRGILHQIRGQYPQAKAELNRALELDPTSANMTSDLGDIHYFANEDEKAEELLKKAESMEAGIARVRLIHLFDGQVRETEAHQAEVFFECLTKKDDEKINCEDTCREAFKKGGRKGAARESIEDALKELAVGELSNNEKSMAWFNIAIWNIRLGDNKKAAESLERSFNIKSGFGTPSFVFPFIATNPMFENVQNEPQVQEILQKMNLP
jgi:DNA-binding winged helix-turn-helix (wHTH) protein/TolB-like protein/Flp pilus assembly protein TadD